jgi:hypothetical protein
LRKRYDELMRILNIWLSQKVKNNPKPVA